MVAQTFYAVEFKHDNPEISCDFRIITRNQGRADIYLAQLRQFYHGQEVRGCEGCGRGACIWRVVQVDHFGLGLCPGEHDVYFDVLYDEGIINLNIRDVGLPNLTDTNGKERLHVVIGPLV